MILPIHSRLRRETAALHGTIETRLDLLGGDLSLARYLRVLRAFHGFHGPVEAELRRLASLASMPSPLGFPLPARTALLERDLFVLGMSPGQIAELPRCADLPRLRRIEHLAGCLYVLEGASLGGQVIARSLRRGLALERESGAAFFVGDGNDTGSRWRRLLAWLDELVSAGAHTDEVVAAACETFATLTRWAQLQGAAR